MMSNIEKKLKKEQYISSIKKRCSCHSLSVYIDEIVTHPDSRPHKGSGINQSDN